MDTLDPIVDRRWPELLERHPMASVFHTPGWLQALQRTYGFAPVVFTTSAAGTELKNGVVFCRINSWATGRRLVSLPYSDHCDPLFDEFANFGELVATIKNECSRYRYKYAEVRPLRSPVPLSEHLEEGERFLFHSLNLTPPTEKLYAACDKSCVQQRIRRAAKEDLVYAEGRSESLLLEFYRLMVVTRHRHQLPPQPIEWYRNLITCLGTAVTIHLIKKSDQAIAGILTLGYKRSLVAKYSCSDERYKKLGATPLLFWNVIQYGKEREYRELDLGRCDLENEGLATFKRRLGAVESGLSYWRYSGTTEASTSVAPPMRLAKQVFALMPERFLIRCGRLLYRHFD